jgi:hypothetical protein
MSINDCNKNTIYIEESWIFCRNCGSGGAYFKSLYNNRISPNLYVGHKCGNYNIFTKKECNCVTTPTLSCHSAQTLHRRCSKRLCIFQ